MTTEDKLTIPMSERRPLKITKEEWPKVAGGSAYSGQHEFQAFDGAKISVRQSASDGRRYIVYGYAGDWDGGGRPERENRTAGFLVETEAEIVRAIRRVAGILADTECVGELAERAAVGHGESVMLRGRKHRYLRSWSWSGSGSRSRPWSGSWSESRLRSRSRSRLRSRSRSGSGLWSGSWSGSRSEREVPT